MNMLSFDIILEKHVYHSMWLKNVQHYILFMMILCACDTHGNTFMQIMSKYCYQIALSIRPW
jgi:hypothetical protein